MTDVHESSFEKRLDRELGMKGLVIFGIALVAILVAVAAAMWGLSLMLRGNLQAQDPPRPLLPEARMQPEPPEPRLQPNPNLDLELYLAEQSAVLEAYEWIDEGSGVARVPVERAIDLALETGLFEATEPAASEIAVDETGAAETEEPEGETE